MRKIVLNIFPAAHAEFFLNNNSETRRETFLSIVINHKFYATVFSDRKILEESYGKSNFCYQPPGPGRK
jgi:hypothetical protein